MRLCKLGKKSSIAFIKYFSKIIREIRAFLFIYFLIEIDILNTRSGQSYLVLANENAHQTTHERIKICLIKVKIKLKFVASASEHREDGGD